MEDGNMRESDLLVILLLSISTSLDNFGIGITYGVRRINIPFTSNLIIAGLNSAGNFVSMFFGESIYHIIDADRSKYLGALLIMGIGLWVIVKEIILRRNHIITLDGCNSDDSEWNAKLLIGKIVSIYKNPVVADVDSSGDIGIKESLLLGLALTLSNIAGGVGAGMMGLDPVVTTIGVFIFSIITILVGMKVGRYWLARLFGNLTGPVAGVLLILISIYEFVS